ncbi:hypothetical protein AB9N12_19485 [Bacteroides sp. AN502(2024)]
MKFDGHLSMDGSLQKAVDYLDSFRPQIMAYRNNGRYSIDNNMVDGS